MRDQWFPLEKAAAHLGVSTRTLRRWIKAGKLGARLEPGPYGRQYLVPISGIAGGEIVREVERAEVPQEREPISPLAEQQARRESLLGRELAALREEMQQAFHRVEARQEMLSRQLDELRRDLQTPPHDLEAPL